MSVLPVHAWCDYGGGRLAALFVRLASASVAALAVVGCGSGGGGHSTNGAGSGGDGAGGTCSTCSGGGGSGAAANGASGGTGGTGGAGDLDGANGDADAGATGGTDAGGTAGGFVIVDVPSSDCTHTTATPVIVAPTDPYLSVYDQIGIVGDRRFIFGSASLTLLTFGSDGLLPSPVLYGDFLAVDAVMDRLAVLVSEPSALALDLYDANANATGTELVLTSDATGSHRLAVGPDAILAAYRANDVLRGQLVALDSSRIIAPFTLDAGSCGVANCHPAAVWNGRDFGLAWSRDLQDGRSKLSWIHVQSDGTWAFAKTIALTTEVYELVDMERIDPGYVLLLREGFPTRDPIVVFLDDFGNFQAPAYRLLGGAEPWDIATVGSEVGVVSSLTDGRAAFRSFSFSGEPSTSWVCLDDSAPDTGVGTRAALSADGDGYDFVVLMSEGSAAYLRTDHLGMSL